MIVDVGLATYLVNHFGFGRHLWDLPQPLDIPKFILTLWVRATITLVAMLFTKTAFAITLLRLTEGLTKRFLWFVIISINMVLGVNALLLWVQCRPVAKIWHLDMPGKCFSTNATIKYAICVSGE